MASSGTLAPVKSPNRDVALRHLLRPLMPFLEDDTIPELAMNRPGEVWTRGEGGWRRHELPELTSEYLESLTRALAVYNGLPWGSLMSVALPGGERGQVVRRPACVLGFAPIAIRKHRPVSHGLEELAERGAFSSVQDVSFHQPSRDEARGLLQERGPRGLLRFEAELLAMKRDGDLLGFCRAAVLSKRNIVVSGKTFSGKTTLARALVAEVPASERIVTIEDVHELELPNPNRVALLFGQGEGRESAEACLAASMRLSADRIFLGELRGSEAWEYVMGLNTGHPGSVTTTHANSAVETLERLASLVKNSQVGRGLERAEVRRELYRTIDVVLFMASWKVVEMFYDPIFKREQVM